MFRDMCVMATIVIGTIACEPMEIWMEDVRGDQSASAEPNMPTAGSSKIPTKAECTAVFNSFGADFQFEENPSIPQAVRLFTLSHGVTAMYAMAGTNGYQQTSGTGDLLTSCAGATALVRTVHDLYVKGVVITHLIHGGSYKPGETIPGTAVLSEHANGTAVDIVGMKNGPTDWTVQHQYGSGQIQKLRTSLNAFFDVVLDPENSTGHADHFHAARPISALIGNPLGSQQQPPPQQAEAPTPSGSTPSIDAPFASGTSVKITQGFGGYVSHNWATGCNGTMPLYYSLDFKMVQYTPVLAVADGVVTHTYTSCKTEQQGKCNHNVGNEVVISHANGGYFSTYYHLEPGSICAKKGYFVYRGDQIGQVGKTGTSSFHLHFHLQNVPGNIYDDCGKSLKFDGFIGSKNVSPGAFVMSFNAQTSSSCKGTDLTAAGFKDEEDDEPPQNGSPQDQDGDGFADDTDCDDGDPSVFPNAKEYCNGIDDNCDGKADENFPAIGTWCYDGYGACKVTGTYLCASNGTSQICSATAKAPKPEICGNNIDDDCDDEIDEGCGSVPPVSSSNELEITVKAGKTLPAIDFSFCYDPGITDPKDCYQWNQSVKTVFSGDSITWKMDVKGGATRFNSTLFKDQSDVQDGKTKPGSGDAWLCEGVGANAHLTLQVTAKLGGKDISDKVKPVPYGSGCSGGIGLNGL